ncbi:MAG: POTRA domain-containing protein [Alphaproteobacteria bacterium]|nr:POTRA domain-containing protein [Alphaproteobacteria bacterium]
MLLCALCLCMPLGAVAQVAIPNSADISRIKPEEHIPSLSHTNDGKISIPSGKGAAPVPDEAKRVKLTLKSLKIIGATVYAPAELDALYATNIGKDITLDAVYKTASAITEKYRNDGYFLSRAFVPEQEIEDGNVTIRVVEGYVGAVDGTSTFADSAIVNDAIERLTHKRPLTSDDIERFLLLLDDLPGYEFGGTLSPLEDAPDGAVKLTLTVKETQGTGSINFDNHSSRFLGPNEISASYSKSFIPFQQTTISALSDVDRTKLRYGTIDHSIALSTDMKLNIAGGVTQAMPGYSLESSEIDSISIFASIALNYQLLRTRQQNLGLKACVDGRDVKSDILGAPLTRDYIRAFRASANYDLADGWHGFNNATITLAHGVDWLGSSHPNDLNLSRIGALPDFTKGELSLSRLQSITQDWSVLIAGEGQWASGVLYSSEQFGYGGQNFGRAYDSSDITGDHGIKGSVEMRYGGWTGERMVNLQPYVFYDIGKVWNEAVGQPSNISASTAGIGLRFNTQWKQSGNLGVAFPLDRDITTPIYGSGERGPRFILQISQQF